NARAVGRQACHRVSFRENGLGGGGCHERQQHRSYAPRACPHTTPSRQRNTGTARSAAFRGGNLREVRGARSERGAVRESAVQRSPWTGAVFPPQGVRSSPPGC